MLRSWEWFHSDPLTRRFATIAQNQKRLTMTRITRAQTTPLHPDAHIAVFARAPELGQVKTRLIPAIGADKALALYTAMLDRTLKLVTQSGLAPMSLWVTSNPSHKSFTTHCNKKEIFQQKGADLGQRMAYCAQTVLAQPQTGYLLITGTDCPALTTDYLRSALVQLQQGQDCVLGPARDGGYVLIGLRRPVAEVFQGIQWGSARVLEQTLAVLAELGLEAGLLEELWDVDEPADLSQLDSLQPPLKGY